jgi:hypothetical protein
MEDNVFAEGNKKDAILSKLQQDIDAADDYYTKTIEPLVIERYEIYGADKDYYRRKYPRLSKRCDIVSTDVQDTIESTMPALMKTFFGSTDVVTVQGMDGTPDDEQRAEKMQALINYQLERQHFFMTFYQWAKDALITNLGIIKIDWERTYKETQERITLLPEVYEQFAQQAAAQGVQIINAEYDPNGGIIVDYVTKVVDKNQPRIMNILASEFRFSPEATSLEDADYVAHRKIVSIDYLRKQAESGLYDPQAVEEVAAKETTPEYTTLDKNNNDSIDEDSNQTDSGRRKVVLYECYVNINMTDDPNGQLTPMIITVASNVILRMEENTYERHPFFVLAPRIDPHKVWPKKGFVDLIAQVQHAKTAIIRQMIYNIALNNDSRLGVNTAMLVDVNDVLEGAQVIRVNGDVKQAIQQIPPTDIQPWTFNMLEYLDMTKENRTGITRYNQGLDSNSLNKTATGINIITQASNQRLELIARIFAETGLRDMFKFLIKLNQLFISQETVIRLTNEPMPVKPDDLEGEFDLVINSGMGSGAKEQNLQDMQMLQGLMTQLAQAGFVGPQQIYNAGKKFIETIGFKNVDDFIMKPEEAMQYQQQMAMQAGNQNQPFSERLNIDWDSLPWEIQAQIIQREGYQVAPEMFADKAAEEVLKEGAKEASKADAHRGEHNDIRAGAGVPAAGGQRTAGAGGAPGNAGVSGRY